MRILFLDGRGPGHVPRAPGSPVVPVTLMFPSSAAQSWRRGALRRGPERTPLAVLQVTQGILRNKLTGPGFSPLSNLRCFSLCCLSLSSFPVCANRLPLFEKGQEVRLIIILPSSGLIDVLVFLRVCPPSPRFGQCVAPKLELASLSVHS